MARSNRIANDKTLVLLTGIIVGVAVIGVLYWAQRILIPVALALFLAFLLNPIVMQFQRRGFPRVFAVIAVTLLSAALFLGFGWLVASQLNSLASELPGYAENIKRKMQALAELSEDTPWPRIQATMRDLGVLPADRKAPPPEPGLIKPLETPRQPMPVIVEQTEPTWLRWLPNVFGPATELLGQIGLVIVLVIFVLLSREDLRNRFIRLVGHGRMTVTTKAVDDASQRLSRFLLTQLLLNAAFGLLVTVGLTLIGVPFPLLWGFLGGLLRYAPYIGAPLAALFPIMLSVAQSDNWLQPALVAGLILGLELLSANVFEPWLFGRSIGVSAVALLVAAAFWAFLWGPIGLVLSCPLTVCLVVLGKYVPRLEFLIVLMGDQPALDEDFSYYQRLSARDEDEATGIVLQYVKDHPVEEVYDALLIPGLTYANRDLQRGVLDDPDVSFVQKATRKVLEDLADLRQELNAKAASPSTGERLQSSRDKVRVLGIPARDESDEIALTMLDQLLEGEACELKIVGLEVLASEVLAKVKEETPVAVCISAVPPGGMARARFLYKRLQTHFPDLHLIVGHWGLTTVEEENDNAFPKNKANPTRTSLLAARDDLVAWLPALTEKADDQAAAKGNVDGGPDSNDKVEPAELLNAAPNH